MAVENGGLQGDVQDVLNVCGDKVRLRSLVSDGEARSNIRACLFVTRCLSQAISTDTHSPRRALITNVWRTLDFLRALPQEPAQFWISVRGP